MTLECLSSVKEQTSDINFEVLVVDNNSQDGSPEAIVLKHPWVKLYDLKENLGFAAANNFAAQKAIGNYLLLLNPDTIIKERAIEKLFCFAKENPESGIWGGRTIFPDGSLNNTCCYNNMTIWSLFCRFSGFDKLFNNSIFNPETFGKWEYNTIKHVDIITGCFLLIKRVTWNQLNGFNPLYFMYGEEVDLCIRASKIGCNPLYTPDAEIIHYGGASENGETSRMPKVFRAKSTLIREHWFGLNKSFGLFFLQTWVLSRVINYAIIRKLLNKKLNDKQMSWFSLWKSRKEWIKGF